MASSFWLLWYPFSIKREVGRMTKLLRRQLQGKL